MLDLTEALNRILNWLQRQKREYPQATEEWWFRLLEEENNAPFVKPGLSSAEIEEITRNIQQEFPPEVYQLYQWRNGSFYNDSCFDWLFDIGKGWGFFMGLGFHPLQTLVQKNSRHTKTSGLNLFIGSDCKDGYLIYDKYSQSFPIICIGNKGGAGQTISKYASLTDMMLTIADCYEQAYYINANGYFSKDENKALEIWQKYNSHHIVSATLSKIAQLEPQLLKINTDKGFRLLEETANTWKWTGDFRFAEILMRVLQKPPTNTNNDEQSDYFRSQASKFLWSSSDSRVVKPLIKILEEEYWLTRYYATIALGYLGDDSAIPALNEMLQDNNEMVREAAQNTLSQIEKRSN
ncbi:MAG: HEAT repeat domain-containing protein [Rivularia sp. (in: cyanobacteria)]